MKKLSFSICVNGNYVKEKTIDDPGLSMLCKLYLKYHVAGVCYKDHGHNRSHYTLTGNDTDAVDKAHQVTL